MDIPTNILPPNMAIEMEASSPLELRTTEQGGLILKCFQQIGVQENAVAMYVKFDPLQTTQLLKALDHFAQIGAIKSEIPKDLPAVQ